MSWQDVQDWLSKELAQLGVQQPQQPPEQPQPEQPPAEQAPSGPDWPVLGGALQLGENALELAGRPQQAVAGVLTQTPQSLGGDLGEWGRLLNPATAGDVLSRHPEIGQAGWAGLTGQRRIDPTELPGMSNLPDEGPQIGPVHITPRTIGGFLGAAATDPLNYTPAVLGHLAEPLRLLGTQAGKLDAALEGLRAPSALARAAGPAHVATEAALYGMGPVQGAALAGRDPETGAWDPGRTAAGAAAGLALPFVPRAVGAGVRAARGAPAAAVRAADVVLPEPQLAYASTGQTDYTTLGLGGLIERALRNREAGLSESQVRQDIADNVLDVPPAHVEEAVSRAMRQYPQGTNFTPDIFGGEGLPTQGSVFGDTPAQNRAAAAQEMRTAGAQGLFDEEIGPAAQPEARTWQVGDYASVKTRGRIAERGATIVTASPAGAWVRTEDGEEHMLRWGDVHAPRGEEPRQPPTAAAEAAPPETPPKPTEDVARAVAPEDITRDDLIAAHPGFAQAVEQTHSAYEEFQTAQLKYRSGTIDDQEFLTAKQAYDAAKATEDRLEPAAIQAATAAPTAEPPLEPVYPIRNTNFGSIQDEGQLRARIDELTSGQPGRGIRMDLEPGDMEGSAPAAHIQARMEAVQDVADRAGFKTKLHPDPSRMHKSMWLTFEPKEITVAAPAAEPMTTPPGRAPAQPPAPATVPERAGQAPLVPKQTFPEPKANGTTEQRSLFQKLRKSSEYQSRLNNNVLRSAFIEGARAAARGEDLTAWKKTFLWQKYAHESAQAGEAAARRLAGVEEAAPGQAPKQPFEFHAHADSVEGRKVGVEREGPGALPYDENDLATQLRWAAGTKWGHMSMKGDFPAFVMAAKALGFDIADVRRRKGQPLWRFNVVEIEPATAAAAAENRIVERDGKFYLSQDAGHQAGPIESGPYETRELADHALASYERAHGRFGTATAKKPAPVARPGVERVIRVLRDEEQPPAEPIERNEFGVPLQSAAQEGADRLSFIQGQMDSIEGALQRGSPEEAFGSRDINTLRAWLADLGPTDPLHARMQSLIEQKTVYDATRAPSYLPGDRIEGVQAGQGSGAQGGRGMYTTDATVVSGPNSDGTYTLRMKNGKRVQQRPGANWKPATKLDDSRTPVKRKPEVRLKPEKSPYGKEMGNRTGWAQGMRQQDADAWRAIRRWLATADADKLAEFDRGWQPVPHKPAYGLDLIRQIESKAGTPQADIEAMLPKPPAPPPSPDYSVRVQGDTAFVHYPQPPSSKFGGKGMLQIKAATFPTDLDGQRKTVTDAVFRKYGVLPPDEQRELVENIRQVMADEIHGGQPEAATASGPLFGAAPPTESIRDWLKQRGIVTPPESDNLLTSAPDPNDQRRQFEFRLRVVPLADLVTSHTDDFTVNPSYPRVLQPRERDRAASMQQINKIVAEFAPSSVANDFQSLDRGTPTIATTDGRQVIVESGNGRTLALRRIQQTEPEKWAAYQEAIRSELADRGAEGLLEGVDNPVLVRERLSDIAPEEFVRLANQDTTARMSATETARLDMPRLTDDMIAGLRVAEGETLDKALVKELNAPFVRQFVGKVPATEHGTLMKPEGGLSKQGIERIKAAILAKTYPGADGERLVQTFLESTDADVSVHIQNAVMANLPTMAVAQALIRNGERAAELSIGNDLAAATNVLARLRQSGISVADYLAQTQAFEQELNPLQLQLLALLDALARKPAQLREVLNEYAQGIIDSPHPGEQVLPGMEPPLVTTESLLDAATRTVSDRQPEPIRPTQPTDVTLGAGAAPEAPTAALPGEELEGTDGGAVAGQPGEVGVSGPRLGGEPGDTGAAGPEPVQAAGSAEDTQAQTGDQPPPVPPTDEPLEPPAAEEPDPRNKTIKTPRGAHTRAAFLEPDEIAHVTRLHDTAGTDGKPLLTPAQVVGVSKALVAMNGRAQADTSGFLLLDGMGLGKSRQMLATSDYYAQRGHPVIIVTQDGVLGASKTYWADRNAWSGSFRDDATAIGVVDKTQLLMRGEAAEPGKIHLTTYTQLGLSDQGGLPFKLPPGPKPVLMFDESQNLKVAAAKRTQAAQRLIDQAHAVLFASATPFDQAGHFDYLAKAGVFEPDFFKTSADAYQDLGMRKAGTGWTAEGNEIEFNARLEQKMDRLTDKGLMLRREFGYDGVPIEPRDFEMSPAGLADQATIEAAYAGRGANAELEAIGTKRRAIEPHKVPIAVRMAQEALVDPNAQVVLFTSGLNPGAPRVKVYAIDPRTGKVARHTSKTTFVDPETGKKTPRKPGDPVIDHTEPMTFSNGSTWIDSPVHMLREQLIAGGLDPTEIAEIHTGLDLPQAYMDEKGITTKPPKTLNPGDNAQQMKRFQNGQARVVIVTIASGGTGINLDDRAIGGVNHPRTVIFLNPDWSAGPNIQATGRVWRLPTTSFPSIHMLRAKGVPMERTIYTILGRKYATLGAAVGEGMISALGPEEMKSFRLNPDVEARHVPLDFEAAQKDRVRQAILRATGAVVDIVPAPRGNNAVATSRTTGKRLVLVRMPDGTQSWSEVGRLAYTPEDAARLAVTMASDKHLPLRPEDIKKGMRVWDPELRQETTIERVTLGPGRESLLQGQVPPPAPGEVFERSRYVMTRVNRDANAVLRFPEDLRRIETEEAVAPPGDPPVDTTPDVVPDVQAAPPDQAPVPADEAAAAPTAAPPAPAPPTAAPPTAQPTPATPVAPPQATPPAAAPTGPTAGPPPAAPSPAPPAAVPGGGSPGGGAPPPPTPPTATPAPPAPPPPPVPGTAPELERVHAMLDRAQAPQQATLRDRVTRWVDEAGRMVADRAQPLNRSTGRALAAVGRSFLPPEVQAELQYGLLGGRAEAAKVRVIQALKPTYDLLRAEGLMDAKGTPRWLNIYRKAQRDMEVANMKDPVGGVRKASADINSAAEAQNVLDQLRTEIGPHRYGVIERAHAMVQTEMDLARQDLVEAGLLSQERADLLQAEHPNYNRVVYAQFIDDGHMPDTGQTASQDTNTIRRLAKDGANEDTEPAMESLIRSLVEIEYNTRRNKAATAIVTTMQHDPFISPYLERAPIKLRSGPESGGMRQPSATIVDWGRGEEKGEIHYFEDGKRRAYRLKKGAPDDVRRAWDQIEDLAKDVDVPAAGLMASLFGKLNQPLRWGATTLSIPFQARNFIRDSINLFIQEGFSGLKDLPGGFHARLATTPEYQEIMRAGGGFNSLYNVSPTNMEQAIQQSGGLLVRNSSDLRDLLKMSAHGKFGMGPLTESIEAAPRVAAYRAARRRGATPEEAALRYRRVTVDWNRAGAALRQINPFILFANARTQGALNMARVLRDNKAAKYRLGGLAVASLLAYAWNRNQPGDQDIPDYIKNQSMYWVLPGATKDAAGDYQNLRYVAVPLGEWAAFTAPLRMFFDGISHRDPSDFWDSLSQELQQVAPGPLPITDPTNFAAQMLPAPMRSIIELNTNKRLFSDTPIVPRSMENLPRQEQKQPYTSEGSIHAANLAARLGHPVSPIQIDFAMRENLGGLGTMLLGISDQLYGKVPDTLPVVGSIAAGIYRTYGGQEQTDRYNLADKLQRELEDSSVAAIKSLPAYQQANPQTQRQMLVAAQDELKRATQQAQGISPGAIPSQRGLPPKYQGVTSEATQHDIDSGVSAVTQFIADPLNNPVPSREQMDFWHQYSGKVDPAYSAAVKARSKDTDAARGQVAQVISNSPPPATGSDAEALQRAAAIKVTLDSTPRYIDARGQAAGTPELWDRWDQWLSRYNSLPARDPKQQWMPHPLKLQYRQTAQQLLAMQNQARLRMSLSDPDYQRIYGIGRGLSDETWAKIRSTPKYKDLPAGADAQSAARDAFLAAYRKLPPRDPRRLQYRLQALKYQRQLNKAYSAVVPTDKFLEQYGTSNLDNIDEPAA